MEYLKVNNKVKNGENVNVRMNYAEFLRLCRARYEADKIQGCIPVELSGEHYKLISDMLRLSGNGDVPVSTYVETALIAHAQEMGLEELIKS